MNKIRLSNGADLNRTSSSAYQRLKNLTQRLRQLENKARRNFEQFNREDFLPISRVKTFPQLSSSSQSLRKIQSMSTMNFLPMESSSSRSHDDKSHSTNKDKQISFEVKTNSYNRKIQVKTKQEDTICSTKSPAIVTRIITTETPPHRVSVIRGQRRSSSKSFSLF